MSSCRDGVGRAAVLLLLVGCMDKAKADYDRCVERDQSYDVKGALAACSAAVAADPKSPSGQAAAKKLADLALVNQKLQAEADDKAARDAKIHKEETLVVPAPTATAVTSAVAVASALPADLSDEEALAQAQALFDSGDLTGARALLEPRVLGRHAKPTMSEGKLLREICETQKDKRCLGALSALIRKLR